MAGVYRFNNSAQLTGTLTLDAQGNPNALFVFQIGSTLTTASGSSVKVINGGANNGVYWQVGSSATLGTSTVFAGNILALTSITMTTSAEILCGRALARNGAVTMDTNVISGNCASGGDFGSGRTDFGSAGFSGAAAQVVPEPGTLGLLSLGLLGGALYGWQSRKRVSFSQIPGRVAACVMGFQPTAGTSSQGVVNVFRRGRTFRSRTRHRSEGCTDPFAAGAGEIASTAARF